LACATSSGITAPELVSWTRARLEASNSTGSVIAWNTTAPLKNRIPRSINSPETPGMLKNRPIMNSGKASMLPNPATGASTLRNWSGA
jgi:hypothetical protein